METLTLPLPPAEAALRRPLRPLELIGNTPMLDLSGLLGRPGVRLLAKAEFANPGGSVKDRPGLAMVLDARRRGLFEGGRRRRDPGSAAPGRRGAGALGLPRPILQPRELALALPHDRTRDLDADGRRDHP